MMRCTACEHGARYGSIRTLKGVRTAVEIDGERFVCPKCVGMGELPTGGSSYEPLPCTVTSVLVRHTTSKCEVQYAVNVEGERQDRHVYADRVFLTTDEAQQLIATLTPVTYDVFVEH